MHLHRQSCLVRGQAVLSFISQMSLPVVAFAVALVFTLVVLGTSPCVSKGRFAGGLTNYHKACPTCFTALPVIKEPFAATPLMPPPPKPLDGVELVAAPGEIMSSSLSLSLPLSLLLPLLLLPLLLLLSLPLSLPLSSLPLLPPPVAVVAASPLLPVAVVSGNGSALTAGTNDAPAKSETRAEVEAIKDGVLRK